MLKDFIYNRTTGQPSSIFKHLGDAAKLYCSTDDDIVRTSNIPFLLAQDKFETIPGLTGAKVKDLCTVSVFKKSNRFKVINSPLISTQVFRARNLIEGEFRGAKIHDQIISWNLSLPDSSYEIIVI